MAETTHSFSPITDDDRLRHPDFDVLGFVVDEEEYQ